MEGDGDIDDEFEKKFNEISIGKISTMDIDEEKIAKRSASRDLICMLIKMGEKDTKKLKSSISGCVDCVDISKYTEMKMKMAKTSTGYRAILMQIEEEISEYHDKLFDYIFDINRKNGRKKIKYFTSIYGGFKISVRNASEKLK